MCICVILCRHFHNSITAEEICSCLPSFLFSVRNNRERSLGPLLRSLTRMGPEGGPESAPAPPEGGPETESAPAPPACPSAQLVPSGEIGKLASAIDELGPAVLESDNHPVCLEQTTNQPTNQPP